MELPQVSITLVGARGSQKNYITKTLYELCGILLGLCRDFGPETPVQPPMESFGSTTVQKRLILSKVNDDVYPSVTTLLGLI